jgi:hypothetical protein
VRIIENGGRPFFKSVFPDETIQCSTSHTIGKHDPAGGLYALSLRTLPALYRTLQEPADLIVCEATFFSPLHWQCLARALFDCRAFLGKIPLCLARGVSSSCAFHFEHRWPSSISRTRPSSIAAIFFC